MKRVGSGDIDPAVARMTTAELLGALEELELRGLEGVSSRYKPLALLWAIGRLEAGHSRLTPWSTFRREMPLLQQRYGRPLPQPDLQYPFWESCDSKLWEVVGIEGRQSWPYAPSVASLDEVDPSGGLTSAAAAALNDARVRRSAVAELTARFFPELDRAEFLHDLGLTRRSDESLHLNPGQMSASGPLGSDHGQDGGRRTEVVRPTSRAEEGIASWLSTDSVSVSSGGSMEWKVVLRRRHIRLGTCPLPNGQVWAKSRPSMVWLKHSHPDSKRLTTHHRVGINCPEGEWELSGVLWPATVRPGITVWFRWEVGSKLAVANTVPIAEPEYVNGTEYLYEYDRKVAVRASADRYRVKPNRADGSRSDKAWVLRTLLVLGYLTSDGTAILASDALVDNCISLGYPRPAVYRLPSTVAMLKREGVIQTILGSVDRHGRPSHPPRGGETPTTLLLHKPEVTVTSQPLRDIPTESAPRDVRAHEVAGHIRKLPPGRNASDQAKANYRAAVQAARVVGQHLGEDETFVRQHDRGGQPGRTRGR